MTVKSPVDIERQLEELRAANQHATKWLEKAEYNFGEAQAGYEPAFQRALLDTWRREDQTGWTETRRKAWASTHTEDQRVALIAAETEVKAARARVNGLRFELDTLRSQSALMRSALELT